MNHSDQKVRRYPGCESPIGIAALQGLRQILRRPVLALAVLLHLGLAPALHAQPRSYVGFVYPAGGQQGTTFTIRVGGQGLDDPTGILVTGNGVTGKITEYYRRLNPQEMQLLNEQLRALRRLTLSKPARESLQESDTPAMMSDTPAMMMTRPEDAAAADSASSAESVAAIMDKIEKRTMEYVQNPACASIASLVMVEITVTPDAEPGERELRLVTLRGVSNPLPFYVGQLPESSRPPMKTAIKQVLGKESQALRKRLPGEEEQRVSLPCTVNGQVGSGEVNRYRFEAARGQRLVFNTLGRQLVPFIADAVPGWFQPVLTLYDSRGKEVAYADDYRFKPDPVILFQVPEDGEYVLEIRDGLYRGREDFVYRISMGELPFITSHFPLGHRAGEAVEPVVKGWNLDHTRMEGIPRDAKPGVYSLFARQSGQPGLVSPPVPFVIDDLPEVLSQPGDHGKPQKVRLPVMVNGRIAKPGEQHIFEFTGKANEALVAEVHARSLDSPLDSVLRVTDASGSLLAFNDDFENLAAGANTHHADSCVRFTLPADGTYFVHVSDAARQGGPEYGYRLRLAAPAPDFELRVVPSSIAMRARGNATVTVYAQRKDGFAGPIRLVLQDPPAGFSASPVTLSGTQTVARLSIRTTRPDTEHPARLQVVGKAEVSGKEIVRPAVPAEDRMQAFLWRHLVPAQDLVAMVFDPSRQLPARRQARMRPSPPPSPDTNAAPTNVVVALGAAGTNTLSTTNAAPSQPRFTPQQIAGRLRQLKLLFEEGVLTDEFYETKVAECEAGVLR